MSEQVADLPTALQDNDEEAKRFDMLVLRTQLAILQAQPGYTALRDQLQAIASALEAQAAIPAIQAEMLLIQAMAGDEWWDGVTLAMLETARKKLRALVKLMEKSQRKVVFTDFEDELGEGTTVQLPGITVGMDLARFNEKARQFLRAHDTHLSLQRLLPHPWHLPRLPPRSPRQARCAPCRSIRTGRGHTRSWMRPRARPPSTTR
jgi:type I restriction enzyme R subunit